MPLPCSNSQARKLGRRLASHELEPDDPALLERILAAYDEALARVVTKLSDCCPGAQPTGRLKSRETLVDKLRRTPAVQLPSTHDLAGARIVIDGDRAQQRAAVASIVAAFTVTDERPPEIVDRLENPSAGYRAIHVIVYSDRLPVEIQV